MTAPLVQTSLAQVFAAGLERIANKATDFSWPNPDYQKDPVGFFRKYLRFDPWYRQEEVALSVVHNRRTAVRSGQKCGKTTIAAAIAIWWFCSFPRARVVLTGPKIETVNKYVYREIKMLLAQSGTCLDCAKAAEALNPTRPHYPRPCPHSAIIPEQPHESATSGLQSDDFREIIGNTAVDPEKMAGASAEYLLFLCDEASGIPDGIFEAVKGNLAGIFARLLAISNPTKTDGEFYEAFHSREGNYNCIHISSEDAAETGIPGLPSKAWCREMEEDYGGKESGQYLVRVKGDFAPENSQRVIGRALIDAAIARWESTPADGPLYIGVDPAGEGKDDTSLVARRGFKVLEVRNFHKLSKEAVADEVFRLAADYRGEREPVTINVDATGSIGIPAFDTINAKKARLDYVNGYHMWWDSTLPAQYLKLRSQLWFNCDQWLKAGGAIPDDTKLAAELHAPNYDYDKESRRYVESKKITKKLLRRSPDRADALCLAVWEGGAISYHEALTVPRPNAYEGAMMRPEERIYGPQGIPAPPMGMGRPGMSAADRIYGRR